MSTVLLVARCALAAVLLTAAVSKLADRGRFRSALGDFGAPGPLVGPLTLGIPVLELTLAFLLIPAASAQLAAIGAMGLLTAFSVVLSRALRRGAEADCGCLGGKSATVSNRTLMRNSGLIVLAAPVAIAGPGESLEAAGVPAAAAIALLIVGAGAVLGARRWRSRRHELRLLRRARTIETALVDALRTDPRPHPQSSTSE